MQKKTVWLCPGAAVVAIAAFLGATGGCARTNMTTEVKADGSLTRTVVFKGAPGSPPPGTGGTPTGGSQKIDMGPKLLDFIIVPKDPAWTVTRTRQEDELVITATRQIPAGQALTDDLALKGEKPAAAASSTPASPGRKTAGTGNGTKKALTPPPPPAVAYPLLLSNTVTVKEISPGHLQYREVIHWRGEKPKNMTDSDVDINKILRNALPAPLASDDASVRKVGAALQGEMWRLLFGPGDPLLSTVLFHRDWAEYRITRRLAVAAEQILAAQYGDKITETERKAVAAKVIASLPSSSTSKLKSGAASGGPMGSASSDAEDNSEMPVAMLFRVKMPGKVTSTNGDLDPTTNEVAWAMYSLAPAAADVTLTADCDVNK